jgi:hypothetical protein
VGGDKEKMAAQGPIMDAMTNRCSEIGNLPYGRCIRKLDYSCSLQDDNHPSSQQQPPAEAGSSVQAERDIRGPTSQIRQIPEDPAMIHWSGHQHAPTACQ